MTNGRARGERSPGDFFDKRSPGELVIFSPGERCFFQGNVVFSGDFPLGEPAFPRGTFVPLGERSPRGGEQARFPCSPRGTFPWGGTQNIPRFPKTPSSFSAAAAMAIG